MARVLLGKVDLVGVGGGRTADLPFEPDLPGAGVLEAAVGDELGADEDVGEGPRHDVVDPRAVDRQLRIGERRMVDLRVEVRDLHLDVLLRGDVLRGPAVLLGELIEHDRVDVVAHPEVEEARAGRVDTLGRHS